MSTDTDRPFKIYWHRDRNPVMFNYWNDAQLRRTTERVTVAKPLAGYFSVWLPRYFRFGIGAHTTVSVQNPIALPPHNEPQADLTC